MAETNDDDERTKLLQFFMDYYGRYHNHKETMAWVATTFYIAGAVYVTHAVRGLACSSCNWQIAFSVLLALAGILALRFVCWQFKRRSEGGERVEDCYKILLNEYNKHPINNIKLNWKDSKTADPKCTVYISYTAIVGITILAVVLFNVCP